MNTTQFLDIIKKYSKEALSLIEKKNKDYANCYDSQFRNFDNSANIAGITPEQGLLVRMGDKLLRAGNIINKQEISVKEESIKDTLLDLSNYALILATRIKDRENE